MGIRQKALQVREPGNLTIYIEALGLVSSQFSGIGHYILGVLRGLDALLNEAADRGERIPKVKVLVPLDRLKAFHAWGFRRLKAQVVPLPFLLMEKLLYDGSLPPLDRFFGQGVYIFTRFVSSKLSRSPSAVVVYDLSFEFHKEYADDGNARLLSQGVRRSLGWVDKVITISDNARSEIIEFYGIAPSGVVIATPAADREKFYRRGPDEIARVKKRYGIEGDYILSLSNLEPRKNLGTLVDVYCELPEAVRESLALLLVGSFGWKFGDTMEQILERVEDGHNIIRPGSYVTDDDTPALISGAAMLVYPSHYEGFGMPPLEALACGTPVIAANNSSLPQVVGNAGRLVSCDQPHRLREAIIAVQADLGRETEAAAVAGPIQAQKFCWRQSAQVLLETAMELCPR